MNSFVLQIAFLFFPGLIWERVHTNFALKDKPDQFDVIRRAFIFGVASYAITYCIYFLSRRDFQGIELDVTKPIFSGSASSEIVVATIVAIVCSILHLYAETNNYFSRFLRFIGATRKYGPYDVWDFTFSSGAPSSTYIHLRDFAKQITYAGWVLSFSESEKMRELVLLDVYVYDFEGTLLFESPSIYLARPKDDIDIEFPVPAGGSENG